jgi:hypothetical protein
MTTSPSAAPCLPGGRGTFMVARAGDFPMTQPLDMDPVARARRATEFFGPRVPGQLGCVFDHSANDLVTGHIDVTENLIAGTGFLFAPADTAVVRGRDEWWG